MLREASRMSRSAAKLAVTLEDVYEPYLMQIGFLTRTPRGRCVTQLAYDHLHIQNGAPEQLTF